MNSPCVRNCCLNDNDVCLGCFRTLEEIREWSGLDNEQQAQVIQRSQLRRKQHKTHYDSFYKPRNGPPSSSSTSQ